MPQGPAAEALQDKWNLAYLSYVVLGIGTLLPWNAFITAADYFEAQYPGRHADRLFTICYLPVNLLVLVLIVCHHTTIRPVVRIVGGFLGFTLAVSLVPLLDMAGPGDAAFGLTLALVALCGVCDGFAQGALFGDAATLPPRFTQALVSGTGISGVAVCLLRIATKATLPDTPQGLRESASAYFAAAALVCTACVLLYGVVVPRLPLVRRYREAALAAALSEEAEWGAAGAGAGGGARPWGKGGDEERARLKGGGEDDSRSGGASGSARGEGGLGEGPSSRGASPRRRGGHRYDIAFGAAEGEEEQESAPRPVISPPLGSIRGSHGSSGALVTAPERLEDMLEDSPPALAPLGTAAQHSRRSTDVELVAEDHHHHPALHTPPAALPNAVNGTAAGRGLPAAAAVLPSGGYSLGEVVEGEASMQQALLRPRAGPGGHWQPQQDLSDSIYGYYSADEQLPPSPKGLQQRLGVGGSRAGAVGAGITGTAAGGGASSLQGWLARAWAFAGRAGGGGKANGNSAAAAGVVPLDYTSVLRQLWRSATTNVVIYTITLSIFPGVLAEDVSSAQLGSWYPVALITAFNCADWAGKSAPLLPALRLRHEGTLLWSAVARVLFVPAFHFAATGGAGPSVIGLLTVLLGLSNGFLTSCAMIGAPEHVATSAAALAGNLMVLSLVLGLCIGAACGFLWLL